MRATLQFKIFSCLLFLLVSVAYASLTWDIRYGILPVWSDEFFYYINAMNYYLHGSLEAAVTYTGMGAPVLGGDAHGFMYSLFHGSIAQVVGFHHNSMPYTNLFIMVMAVSILFLFRTTEIDYTFLLATVLLSYITVVMYTFTFMQEALHFLIAVCCSLLLLKIYSTKNRGYIVAFILILIVASLFRNLWLFWTICLLPLAKTKKEFSLYLAIFLASAIVSFLISQVFWDAIPSAFGNAMTFAKSGQMQKAASLLCLNFSANIKAFMYEEGRGILYSIGQLVHIPILIYTGFLYIKTKERIFLAALLIYSITFLLLLVCFIVGSWGEIRTMAPLYYMFAVMVFHYRKKLPVYGLLFVSIITFPGNYAEANKWIAAKKIQQSNYDQESTTRARFAAMGNAIDNNRASLVLLGYIPADYTRDLLYLPLRSKNGQKIKYAVNYLGMDIRNIKYDYILLKDQTMDNNNFLLVRTDAPLSLYKLLD